MSSNTRASQPVGSSLRLEEEVLEVFVELDDVGMGGELFKSLNFSETLDLGETQST